MRNFQDLIDALKKNRQALTEEERIERAKQMEDMLERLNKAAVKAGRCTLCGADTLNFSHTLDCPRRGSGF